MNRDLLRLYFVSDLERQSPEWLLERAPGLARAGVTLFQVRDKQASGRELVALTRALVERLASGPARVIVNDRVDVAWAAGAHGVHLGGQDLSVADARRLLGPEAIIGASVERVDDDLESLAAADYLAASPVFATPTKTDTAPPLGLAGVEALAHRSDKPLVGIGGLHAGVAGAVIRAGADGLAVVSALSRAEDPVAAALELRSEIDGVLKERAY